MAKKAKFHVDHNVKPGSVTKILPILAFKNNLTTYEIYSRLPDDLWFRSGDDFKKNSLNKNINTLITFRLVSKNSVDHTVSISSLGSKMLRILEYNKKLFFDIMHFLYYSTWIKDPKNPATAFSWTYKQICDLLWNQNTDYIDDKKIIGEVYEMASSTFDYNAISLSHYAAKGVKNWLLALEPPFLKKKGQKIVKVLDRDHCSLELVLLSIDLYYVKNKLSHGTPILMRPEKENEIANICLISRDALGNLIDLSVKMFGDLLKWYSSTWGRSLVLSKKLEIMDIGGSD